jgi:hypothetical protein
MSFKLGPDLFSTSFFYSFYFFYFFYSFFYFFLTVLTESVTAFVCLSVLDLSPMKFVFCPQQLLCFASPWPTRSMSWPNSQRRKVGPTYPSLSPSITLFERLEGGYLLI